MRNCDVITFRISYSEHYSALGTDDTFSVIIVCVCAEIIILFIRQQYNVTSTKDTIYTISL